jgi:hypothetical protein
MEPHRSIPSPWLMTAGASSQLWVVHVDEQGQTFQVSNHMFLFWKAVFAAK